MLTDDAEVYAVLDLDTAREIGRGRRVVGAGGKRTKDVEGDREVSGLIVVFGQKTDIVCSNEGETVSPGSGVGARRWWSRPDETIKDNEIGIGTRWDVDGNDIRTGAGGFAGGFAGNLDPVGVSARETAAGGKSRDRVDDRRDGGRLKVIYGELGGDQKGGTDRAVFKGFIVLFGSERKIGLVE